MGTWKLDKDLNVVDINLYPTFKMSKTELYNLQSTIKYLIEDIKYSTPTDRLLVFTIESSVTSNLNVQMVINIVPCFRGKLRNKVKNKNSESLLRKITIIDNFNTTKGDFLEDGLLQKKIKYVLDYYGMIIMYAKYYQQIKVEFIGKEIKVTCK